MQRLSVLLIEKQVREHREWLPDRGERVLERVYETIARALDDETINSLALLSSAVSSLGLYYGTRGVVSLVDGNDSGWADVAGAVECYLRCARLDVQSHYARLPHDRSGRLPGLAHRLTPAVVLLSYFVAVNDVGREQELWSLLKRPLADPHPRMRRWWRQRHFEPFFVGLYAAARGHETPLHPSEFRPHVYANVQEAWSDDAALAKALAHACDYHCRRMVHTRSWTAEFNRTPLDLLPADVFAINALRVASGLRAVEVDHPLMRRIGPIGLSRPPQELVETLYDVDAKHDEFDAHRRVAV